MKKILFINASDPISEIENRYKPLWPSYLAAMINSSLGENLFDYRYVDVNIDSTLKTFDPDIVAISAVSQNYNFAKKYAAQAKDAGKIVIMGGVHISALPETLTENMDIACIGEGEITFLELIKLYLDYEGFPEEQLSKINGIAFFNPDKQLVQTGPRPLIDDINIIPHPMRSIIGYKPHDYMFTSRGCPFRCVFCASSRYWNRVRFSSADYVLEEISELIANGVKTISFYDDLFVADKKRLYEIVDRITASNINKKAMFTCSVRANTITQEVAEALKAMNVISVGLGLESGNDRVLSILKGKITVEDNYRAVNFLKNEGIQTNASFVIGSPDETKEEIMDTYQFIKKSRLDFVDIYVLTPYPGTPVWDMALQKNMVSIDMDWSRLNVNFEVNTQDAIIMSEVLSRKDIIQLYKKFRRLRIFRIIRALPNSVWLKDLPKIAARLLSEKISRSINSLKTPYIF